MRSATAARAADDLTVTVAALSDRVADRCRVLGGVLDVSVPEGLEACLVVAAEVRRRVADLVLDGVRLSLALEPSVCRLSLEAARECVAGCGSGGDQARCLGDLVGQCDGTCAGTCHGECGGACEGTCSDFCEGDCDGACVGLCDGECDTLDRDGRCVVWCDGTCRGGACDGTCRGECSGVCTQQCTSACTGTCVGTCDGAWDPTCSGLAELGGSACAELCEVRAALAAECDLPELRVRGPELEDPRFHAQVDQLVIGVNRHYPELLSIEARLRVTVAPVLDALEAQLRAAPGWEEPSACLPADVDAARARVEAMLAALEALVTAARDTVGTATE